MRMPMERRSKRLAGRRRGGVRRIARLGAFWFYLRPDRPVGEVSRQCIVTAC
ncbi:hypothetical protein [Nocardioides hungaricus]